MHTESSLLLRCNLAVSALPPQLAAPSHSYKAREIVLLCAPAMIGRLALVAFFLVLLGTADAAVVRKKPNVAELRAAKLEMLEQQAERARQATAAAEAVLTSLKGAPSPVHDAVDLAELAERVAAMFDHAVSAYLNNAFPKDELKSLSCKGRDSYGGIASTVVDMLDSLFVFRRYDQFRYYVDWVIDNADFDKDVLVSTFETNIRVVGGLLSAHLICATPSLFPNETAGCRNGNYAGELADHAERLARRLLVAFDSPTGLPYTRLNLRSGVPADVFVHTSVAEAGTFLLEFALLSELTGDPVFLNKARAASDVVYNARSADDLIGLNLEVATGAWLETQTSIGSGVDSFLEYLAKYAILADDDTSRRQFRRLYKGIMSHARSAEGAFFPVEMKTGKIALPYLDSLQIYFPGVQTLLGEPSQTALASQSVYYYAELMKEYGFVPEVLDVVVPVIVDGRYDLRPELIESLYLVHRATGDPQLRVFAETFLDNLEAHCRVECGYAALEHVTSRKKKNRMESFFLAETLKYLYLIFAEDAPLYSWRFTGAVLNTEAHPLWLPSRNPETRTYPRAERTEL